MTTLHDAPKLDNLRGKALNILTVVVLTMAFLAAVVILLQNAGSTVQQTVALGCGIPLFAVPIRRAVYGRAAFPVIYRRLGLLGEVSR